MDPTGHIAILKKVQEKLESAKQGLIDATGDFSDFIEQKTGIKSRLVDQKLAETTGVLGGLAGVASDAVGVVNLAANAYFADKYSTPLGYEARQELEEGAESIKNAAMTVVERPGAVGLQILDAGKKKALALAAGDPVAMADAYATGTQVGTDLALGSKGVKSALSGPRRVLSLAENAGDAAGLLKKSGRVLDKVEDVVDAAPSSGSGLARPTPSGLALHERINARTTEARLEKVARQSFEHEVGQLVGQPGMGRARLGKIAEVRATRTLRRYAEHKGVELGEGGLRFQVRGESSVPDVVYDPARRVLDFKLTPKAVKPGQTSAFRRDFPGYEPRHIFGEE